MAKARLVLRVLDYVSIKYTTMLPSKRVSICRGVKQSAYLGDLRSSDPSSQHVGRERQRETPLPPVMDVIG